MEVQAQDTLDPGAPVDQSDRDVGRTGRDGTCGVTVAEPRAPEEEGDEPALQLEVIGDIAAEAESGRGPALRPTDRSRALFVARSGLLIL
jgi:hypothetical protein